MGTQMQSETYLLRHCPRNLGRSISTGQWLSYQKAKVLEKSQYQDSSSPLPGLVDRYSGHDKEKVKETILEHEVTFRHQVRELHRLYRRQRELMSATQNKRLYKFQMKTDSFQSAISPSVSLESAKRTRDGSPLLSSDSMIGQLDPSSSMAWRSPSTVLKRKNCISFNPHCDMYLHMNKEKTIVEGLSFGLAGYGVVYEDRTKEASKSFFNNAAKYHIMAGDSKSNVQSTGRNYLGYLNEPFQFLSSSPSLQSSCHLSCHADKLERQDLDANVTSGVILPTGSSQLPDLSLHIEHRTESRKKRKIFGVEIAEEAGESSQVSLDSYLKLNGEGSGASPFLSARASASHLTKTVSSPQGSHVATTSELSWLKLGSCLQNLEFVEGVSACDALKSSVPKSELVLQRSLRVHPQLVDGGAATSLDILKGKNDFTSLPDLFEFHNSSNCWKSVNATQLKSRRMLEFDSEITNMSEKVSQHFFKITENSEIPWKEFNLEKSIKDAEDKKDDHVIEKRVGFPSTEVISKNDATDHPTVSVSKKCPSQLVANPDSPEKSLRNYISGLRNHIDLNLSVVEEETPVAAVIPEAIVKIIRPEVDLEVAAVIESEVEPEGSKSLDKSEEPHQYLIEDAAEALVVISSAFKVNVPNYATSCLENTSNCLHWFADVICSHASDEDGEIREIYQGINVLCDVEAVPDGMDYFEFITLQLKGVEETYCYSLSDMEHQKAKETEMSETKRSGRKNRRGRPRKDFQKDVLPDLVSLAKQEVVEDLQTLEELFRSTGKTWKSSLSRRNSTKNGSRGMKSRESLHMTDANLAVPSKQKRNGRALQLRGKSFTGWGKRTRRLPRKRCSETLCSSIQLLASA